MARPTSFNEKTAERICHRIATSSHGLHRICTEEGMPCVATVFNWLSNKTHKTFLENYARAREAQAELLADEIIDIADDATNDTKRTEDGVEYSNTEWISRSRLRVDARKWKASKLYPKKYGDKIEVDQNNHGDMKLTIVRKTIGKRD